MKCRDHIERAKKTALARKLEFGDDENEKPQHQFPVKIEVCQCFIRERRPRLSDKPPRYLSTKPRVRPSLQFKNGLNPHRSAAGLLKNTIKS